MVPGCFQCRILTGSSLNCTSVPRTEAQEKLHFLRISALMIFSKRAKNSPCCTGLFMSWTTAQINFSRISASYFSPTMSWWQNGKRPEYIMSYSWIINHAVTQCETNHYCGNEIKKFLSVFTSIARGKGKQHRYVPVYMISNPVSLVNPYYLELGISSRLRKDTKFLKGKGFVLEQGFNASAKAAQEGSPLLQAFSDSDYVDYAAQGVYLNDNYAFIEKPTGSGSYICTLRSDGKDYAIRAYESEGIVYCDMRVDPSFPLKIAISEADHSPNYVTLHYNTQMLRSLLWFWDKGCFRFKDINCKNAILKALSII